MKANQTRVFQAVLAAAVAGWLGGSGVATGRAQTAVNLSPDVQEVVRLSQEKFSNELIISYIKNTGKTYHLSSDDIIYLSGQGVPQPVISALLQTGTTVEYNSAKATPTGTETVPAASSPPEPPPIDAGAASAPSTAPVAVNSPTMPVDPAPGPAGLTDYFTSDTALNENLWVRQSPLLANLGAACGRLVGSALDFTPMGMQMSGVRTPGQFMGLQSAASFAAPFTLNVGVTGEAQRAIPFEVFLVSGDLQQWVSVAGHFGGQPYAYNYGVWVNHTGNGQPISALGNKIFANPIAGLPYTVQISVGGDGLASVILLDSTRTAVSAQNVPVGTGPFYLVLAGRDGQTFSIWQSVQMVPTGPAPAAVAAAAPAVPAVPNLAYFQTQLAPYGNWVTVPEYGLCWQPAVNDPNWRPYYDGGSWTYTDAGWYWQSDYPWGDIPFHYGRWTYSARGWIWVPGYDYAPAWVVWRDADADGYVGWAPLVPGAVFVEGGWRYRGRSYAADFDFGLGASFYVFIDGPHFWDHDFRRYVVPRDRIELVFHRSVFVNHYHLDHGRYFNDGLDRGRMAVLTHRDVRDIPVRRVAEIRVTEEHRNVTVRAGDLHAFRTGVRPEARRTVEEHRVVETQHSGIGAERHEATPAGRAAEPQNRPYEAPHGSAAPTQRPVEPGARPGASEPGHGPGAPVAGGGNAPGNHAGPAPHSSGSGNSQHGNSGNGRDGKNP